MTFPWLRFLRVHVPPKTHWKKPPWMLTLPFVNVTVIIPTLNTSSSTDFSVEQQKLASKVHSSVLLWCGCKFDLLLQVWNPSGGKSKLATSLLLQKGNLHQGCYGENRNRCDHPGHAQFPECSCTWKHTIVQYKNEQPCANCRLKPIHEMPGPVEKRYTI